MNAIGPAAEGLPRHIVFRAGGERFAVPLEAVREVVLPRPPFARVPRAASGVRGAMNLHGRVVAVVELEGAAVTLLDTAALEEAAAALFRSS